MKFIKWNRKKKFDVKKATKSWNFGSVSAYKETQQSGRLALWICQDMERSDKDEK